VALPWASAVQLAWEVQGQEEGTKEQVLVLSLVPAHPPHAVPEEGLARFRAPGEQYPPVPLVLLRPFPGFHCLPLELPRAPT